MDGSSGAASGPTDVIAFCSQRYATLAAVVLGLAAFNLVFRLGQEIVTQWDESLYAVTAWEMVNSGDWMRTTFLGAVDYYNTKPPLNVWLIALSFKAFGISLVSLRLVPVISAWCTVAVLMAWVRRVLGPPVALFAGVVLATMFGFLYVHSGRSANTDAPFTLLVLLTVVALWAAEDRKWHLVWLGPLAAAVFLLRGMGVLMPLAIMLAFAVLRRRWQKGRWIPALVSLALFIVPVAAWILARWHFDQWRFLQRLFVYDFVDRSINVLETHGGTPLYYLNILQKHHYDWLTAGVLSWILFPVPWQRVRNLLAFWRRNDSLTTLVGCWAGLTLLLPTLMTTKLPWYLNPFYPVCALGIAWLVVHGLSQARTGSRRRAVVLWILLAVAFVSAESELIWYSYHYRSLANSVQGLLLAEASQLAGRQVFSSHWNSADTFVLGGVIRAQRGVAAGPEDFWRQSRPGDYLVTRLDYQDSRLALVRSGGRHRLYRRLE